jgi:hypothetical protein
MVQPQKSFVGVKYRYAKYLDACHLYESRLVYMEGPIPCGVNDISMYKGGDKDSTARDKCALYYKVKGEIAFIVFCCTNILSHISHFCASRATEDS